MKLEQLRSIGLFPILLFLLFATTSCLDEKYESGSSLGSSERLVSFSLNLPGQTAGGSTYALNDAEEEAIHSVELLLFTGGNFLHSRMVSGSEISTTGMQKRFTVQLFEGSYSSIVVLANSSTLVAGAGLIPGDSKAVVLDKLKLQNSGKWIAKTSTTGYRPIPMWSELTGVTVDQNTTATTQATPWSLPLTRMLAKVSVTLNSPAAASKFKLQSIRVYNYYNQGLVAPAPGNWNPGGAGAATAASLPATAAKPGVTNPYTTLTYSGNEITTPEVASTGEIYLFESDNSNQSDLLTRTCLVVGGVYAGDGKTYYYRIDFAQNNSGTDVYLDLLRNHHYKVNVADVTGPGYPTPDEAFSARPFNIECTVVAWNDAHVNSIAVSGQYELSLSQMIYDFSGVAQTAADSENKLTILTDYSDGWNILPTDIIDLATNGTATWLRVDPGDQSGVANSSKTISLLLDQTTGLISRSAKILVKAGVITMVVQVNQNYGLQTSVKPVYHLCGLTDDFMVMSNASWRIKSVTEQVTNGTGPLLNLGASDKLKVGTTGGPNLTGENVTFTTKDLPYPSSGIVTVVFESNDNPKMFNDVTVILNLKGEYYPEPHKGWAGSNIYWDGGKLTFDDVNDQTNSTYQGVFFQWGSLTGISPIRSRYSSTTILYPPEGAPTSGTAWTDIPHVPEGLIKSHPLAPKTDRDRSYLYELDPATGTGDICKYITEQSPGGRLHNKKWRMPTSNEFEPAGNYSVWNYGSVGSSAADGTCSISLGRTKTDIGTPFFPACGYRINTDGMLNKEGEAAHYWSATPYDNLGYYMYFYENNANPTYNYDRAFGLSVRCVVE